jgi:hypothetical protein
MDLGAEALAARRVLNPFLSPGIDPEALTRGLRPLPEDYPRVFRGDLAAGFRSVYDAIWETRPVITRKAHQTVLLVSTCPAEAFVAGHPFMEAFPGGYAGIADILVPGRVWACWKFVAPGQRLGMAWDGLVELDGRWAWFPRPWAFARRLATN